MSNNSQKRHSYSRIIKSALLGRAQAQNILQLSLGQGALDTLKIVNPPEFKVKIKPLSSIEEGLERNGGEFSSEPNTPKGNRFLRFLKNPIQYFKLKQVNGLTLARTPNTMYLNDKYFLKSLLKGKISPVASTITHELQHIFQMRRFDKALSSSFIEDRLKLSEKFEAPMDGDTDFFENQVLARSIEPEIQARIASIIIRDSQQTGRLPTTKQELMKALESQGVVIPLNLETNEEDFEVHEWGINDVSNDAVDLTLIFASVAQEHNASLWHRDIPAVYADMLEDWGDQQGHKRFGHTHNILFREIFYRSIDNAYKLEHSDQFDELWESDNPQIVDMITGMVKENFERAADIIQKMDKDDAIDLGCLVLTGFRYKELGESTFEPPPCANDNVTEFTKQAILDRPDITERDRAILDQAEALYSPNNNAKTRATMREPDGELHSSLTFMMDAA